MNKMHSLSKQPMILTLYPKGLSHSRKFILSNQMCCHKIETTHRLYVPAQPPGGISRYWQNKKDVLWPIDRTMPWRAGKCAPANTLLGPGGLRVTALRP